jgi:4-alpha-glucanotransferase
MRRLIFDGQREPSVSNPTPNPRSAGILLHPTCFPGPYGIGDLGPTAYEWVESLAHAGQKWWQILPLGPTGYGDSPYQCFSAFAGNIYLLSPELLLRDGLLEESDIPAVSFPAERVDYGAVIPFKIQLLQTAWERFQATSSHPLQADFDEYCHRQKSWLDDFALFMALKAAHGGVCWLEWEKELIMRKPVALRRAALKYRDEANLVRFGQFLFDRQWSALKQFANTKGVRLIGDVPIFVSIDSSDVWANPKLFYLDEQRQPTVVAGVPPDYFSATGQLWGNPLYNWKAMKDTGYAWWIARMRQALHQVDLIRLDHFRGFEAYWEIPAGMPTAEKGKWVPGPGADLFNALRKALGNLPLIAEDLGLITPEVVALRKQFDLPGMVILQFAFSGPDNSYLPHRHEHNSVVYTGTHDNDTTVGWYHSCPHHERQFLHRYAPAVGGDIAWDMIRLAWASVAWMAIAPLQDLLSLPSSARMNLPGRPSDNWQWRFVTGQLHQGIFDRLAELTWLYQRR